MGPHKIDPTNIVYHVVNTSISTLTPNYLLVTNLDDITGKGIACMFDAQRGACYSPEVELY